MATPMISAQNVHKSFGQLEVLKGIDLEVQPGEVAGDLAQVVVRQVLDQVVHGRVVAPPLAEVEQLVVEVAGRLAGDAPRGRRSI